MTEVADRTVARPAEYLRPFVHRYHGYRYAGLAPGTHLGLPTPYLVAIISLGAPIRLTVMSNPEQPPGSFGSLVGGLHTRPATIEHDGELFGVQLDISPAGVRSLLGFPAGRLASRVIRLDEVLGSNTAELVERMAAAPDWPSRFSLLDAMLARRVGQLDAAEASLALAWHVIVETCGSARVSDVAAEVGWSRRQLGELFAREYGLTVKEAARVARFHKSRLLIQHRIEPTIAAVAATSGYFDQAHLAREWRELAGCPPSAWVAAEDLPFIQDADGEQGVA